jgi:hypothetical protein
MRYVLPLLLSLTACNAVDQLQTEQVRQLQTRVEKLEDENLRLQRCLNRADLVMDTVSIVVMLRACTFEAANTGSWNR